MRQDFEDKFPKWARAIARYCNETQIRSTSLQQETADYSCDLEEGEISLVHLSKIWLAQIILHPQR